MEKTFKLFLVDSKPYLTIDEDVKIGDKAIVSVNDYYPTLVNCVNDEQINLIQKPKLSMTKRYKVLKESETLELNEDVIDILKQKNGAITVKYNDGEITVMEDL
jgi:hypothetical protein